MATASPNSPLAITILFASLSLSNSSLYSSPNNSSTLTPSAADKVSAVAPPSSFFKTISITSATNSLPLSFPDIRRPSFTAS